jgi:4'-phosphopantetheinyl transferase
MTSQPRGIPKRSGSTPSPGIAVFWANLDVNEDGYQYFAAMLSAHEHRRAEQLHLAVDRRRFVVRHGLLREFLACHFDCGPTEIPLVCEAFQKPYVDGWDVNVSLSHAHGVALYAFSSDVEIGCDIAFEDCAAATMDVAKLFLAPCEIRSLQVLPGPGRVGAFFRYWTAKEAYLKARGTGLSRPMQTVVVSDAGLPRFLALDDDDPDEWSLICIKLPTGYSGALAARCPPATICPSLLCTGEVRRGFP